MGDGQAEFLLNDIQHLLQFAETTNDVLLKYEGSDKSTEWMELTLKTFCTQVILIANKILKLNKPLLEPDKRKSSKQNDKYQKKYSDLSLSPNSPRFTSKIRKGRILSSEEKKKLSKNPEHYSTGSLPTKLEKLLGDSSDVLPYAYSYREGISEDEIVTDNPLSLKFSNSCVLLEKLNPIVNPTNAGDFGFKVEIECELFNKKTYKLNTQKLIYKKKILLFKTPIMDRNLWKEYRGIFSCSSTRNYG